MLSQFSFAALTHFVPFQIDSNAGNPGRFYDDKVDLSEALKHHYDPELAIAKLGEVHKWLKKGSILSDKEKEELGWTQAYNLTTWEEFPTEIITVSRILLARMGLMSGGGNSEDAAKEANLMRGVVRRRSSLLESMVPVV
jgi:hypothetical protein